MKGRDPLLGKGGQNGQERTRAEFLSRPVRLVRSSPKVGLVLPFFSGRSQAPAIRQFFGPGEAVYASDDPLAARETGDG
jgi:hypothetical protein